MTFNADEIFQIASTIWDTAIGVPIELATTGSINNRSRSTAACIQITGAWNGAILLDCPIEVARKAASVMFSTDEPNLTTADLQDAVAELVNMLGGNFKALLTGTCYLSLPAAVEGGDYSTRIPGSMTLGRLALSCEGYAMSIAVLEKTQSRTIAA